jgi:hypothetical protein
LLSAKDDKQPETLDSARPNDPFCIDASDDEMRRCKVANWLCSERAKRKPRRPDGNIDFDICDTQELVSAVLAEPHDGHALEILAADTGKTLVDERGARLPVCKDGETERQRQAETD